MSLVRRALAAAACAAALTAVPALAQEPPQQPLNISADNVTGSHDATGDVVLLNGNVRITRGSTVLTAQTGRYMRARGLL